MQFVRTAQFKQNTLLTMTVSSWELTSVYMRCSKGDGVNTSLSRIAVPTCYSYESVSCLVYGNLPRHDHVLTGTIIIKIMCVHELHLQG